ncbi:MAG: hypothetical protein ACKPKO_40850 [Candidatus Fonsibacter sp.]
MVDQYTADTPQSHQCGFISQSAQSIEELKLAVVGGQVGDDGKESISALNYNAIFTYAVKAIQEFSQIVKAQQVQINELQLHEEYQGRVWRQLRYNRGRVH